MQRLPRKNPLRKKTAVKNASGSRRRKKWPTKRAHRHLNLHRNSEGVRVQFRVRFQAVKVSIFGGFPVENPTKKANRPKALLRAISLSEYGSEVFRVRLRGLSEYGSVACFPKGPFRTKNSTAFESVLFCHHRSFSVSAPFPASFS